MCAAYTPGMSPQRETLADFGWNAHFQSQLSLEELARLSLLKRKAAGNTVKVQLIAANVGTQSRNTQAIWERSSRDRIGAKALRAVLRTKRDVE